MLSWRWGELRAGVCEQPQQATDHREHSGTRFGGILRCRPGDCGAAVCWDGNRPGEPGAGGVEHLSLLVMRVGDRTKFQPRDSREVVWVARV